MPDSRRKAPPLCLRRTAGSRWFEWGEDLLELLAARPDAVVAARLGLKRQAVAAERRRRGISTLRVAPSPSGSVTTDTNRLSP